MTNSVCDFVFLLYCHFQLCHFGDLAFMFFQSNISRVERDGYCVVFFFFISLRIYCTRDFKSASLKLLMEISFLITNFLAFIIKRNPIHCHPSINRSHHFDS